MSYVTTNVRLDPQVYRDLQTQALAEGISLAEAIRRALRRHVAGWRGEAREEAPAYGTAATPSGVTIGTVRDGALVIPAPEDLAGDLPILVAILGPVTEADLSVIRRQDQAREALRRELAGLPDAPPGGLSDEDREIYRP